VSTKPDQAHPSPVGRLAWLPSGTGLATTIYIVGR